MLLLALTDGEASQQKPGKKVLPSCSITMWLVKQLSPSQVIGIWMAYYSYMRFLAVSQLKLLPYQWPEKKINQIEG